MKGQMPGCPDFFEKTSRYAPGVVASANPSPLQRLCVQDRYNGGSERNLVPRGGKLEVPLQNKLAAVVNQKGDLRARVESIESLRPQKIITNMKLLPLDMPAARGDLTKITTSSALSVRKKTTVTQSLDPAMTLE